MDFQMVREKQEQATLRGPPLTGKTGLVYPIGSQLHEHQGEESRTGFSAQSMDCPPSPGKGFWTVLVS